MTDLPYLASRLYGTSLLIARPKLEVIGHFKTKWVSFCFTPPVTP